MKTSDKIRKAGFIPPPDKGHTRPTGAGIHAQGTRRLRTRAAANRAAIAEQRTP